MRISLGLNRSNVCLVSSRPHAPVPPVTRTVVLSSKCAMLFLRYHELAHPQMHHGEPYFPCNVRMNMPMRPSRVLIVSLMYLILEVEISVQVTGISCIV